MNKKKILIIYGLIGGLIIVASSFIFGAIFGSDPSNMDMSMGVIRGYAAMLIGLSTIFFGIRAFRDKQRNGYISFKDAFVNGLIIVLVASVIYVIGWEIYYPNFMPDFPEQYLEYQKEKINSSDMSIEEAQKQISKMEISMENYNNPFYRIPWTFIEIFPIGLLILLISSFMLKRKSIAED